MRDEMRDSVDACLTQALRDVPVPDGLAERLLAGLASRQPRVSRRWLLAASGVLTAAATVLFALWLRSPAELPLSEETVCNEAIRLFDAGFDQPGKLLSKTPAPSGFPYSQWVFHVSQANWRSVGNFLGGRGVVYELPGPGGTRAVLYVVARNGISGFDTMPTSSPASSTAGCFASAWQEDGLLYVLVVQGDQSTYRGYLNLPRSPVA
jgi:hypothetical protein